MIANRRFYQAILWFIEIIWFRDNPDFQLFALSRVMRVTHQNPNFVPQESFSIKNSYNSLEMAVANYFSVTRSDASVIILHMFREPFLQMWSESDNPGAMLALYSTWRPVPKSYIERSGWYRLLEENDNDQLVLSVRRQIFGDQLWVGISRLPFWFEKDPGNPVLLKRWADEIRRELPVPEPLDALAR